MRVKVNGAVHAAATHAFTASTRADDDPQTSARLRQARRASHSLAKPITRSQYISSHCSRPPLLFAQDVEESTRRDV